MKRTFQLSYNRVQTAGSTQTAEPPGDGRNAVGEGAGRGIGLWTGQMEMGERLGMQRPA
jgi:hypothetical protein